MHGDSAELQKDRKATIFSIGVEVDQLIAAVVRKTATFLQLLEETETES